MGLLGLKDDRKRRCFRRACYKQKAKIFCFVVVAFFGKKTFLYYLVLYY